MFVIVILNQVVFIKIYKLIAALVLIKIYLHFFILRMYNESRKKISEKNRKFNLI